MINEIASEGKNGKEKKDRMKNFICKEGEEREGKCDEKNEGMLYFPHIESSRGC